LTEGFRSFCDSQPFKPVFCRKSDPELKGKVENVIKYVNYNFLRGRFLETVKWTVVHLIRIAKFK